jgi:hypothetical protein
MPDGFAVTPSSLVQLSTSFSTIGSYLSVTPQLVGDGSCLGSAVVAEALEDFVTGWRDGRRQIVDSIEGLAAMLAQAAQAYLSTDAAVCPAGSS